jgi:IclR family pca regulon transcriptional regulator
MLGATDDPRFMLSLARGLAVLRAFEGRPSLSVSEAAEISGLSRSSAGRCLYTLERLGYVAGDNGVFRLQPGLLRLARAYSASDPLAIAAERALEQIRDGLGESSSLAVLDPQDPSRAIYVARAGAARILPTPLQIGSSLPCYCTSIGRVLLSGASEADLAAALTPEVLVRRTPATCVDPDRLRAEIARAGERGYALVEGELEAGLRSIAAPVRDRAGRVVGALNVGVASARRSAAWLVEKALPELQAGAAHLSRSI